MLKLLIILSTILLFFAVKWLASLVVDKLPEWLNYQPFNCPTCLSFWLNIGLSCCLTFLVTHWCIPYIIITLLDGVALIIDKRKMKSFDEINNV